MIYYSVAYHKNGCISLKPFDTKEEAEEYNQVVMKDAKWGPRMDRCKVVKKDPESPWFKSVRGYWI